MIKETIYSGRQNIIELVFKVRKPAVEADPDEVETWLESDTQLSLFLSAGGIATWLESDTPTTMIRH